MAVIHITEIQRILAERGEKDALPWNSSEGYFLEIRFDDQGRRSEVSGVGHRNEATTGVVDTELKNKVITADCPYGFVTIQFDEEGQLKSIELS